MFNKYLSSWKHMSMKNLNYNSKFYMTWLALLLILLSLYSYLLIILNLVNIVFFIFLLYLNVLPNVSKYWNNSDPLTPYFWFDRYLSHNWTCWSLTLHSLAFAFVIFRELLRLVTSVYFSISCVKGMRLFYS